MMTQRSHYLRNPWVRAAGFIFALLVAHDVGMQVVYAHRVMPGVKVGPVDMSGKTAAEVTSEIAKRAQRIQQLEYVKDQRVIKVAAADIGLKIDAETTAADAMRQGREDLFARLSRPLGVLTGRAVSSPLHYQLVSSAVTDTLANQTADLASPAKNASIVRVGTNFRIVHEQAGTTVDPAANLQATRRAIEMFNPRIELYIRPQQPEIVASALGQTRAYAASLASSPMTVKAGEKQLTAPPATVAQWITFEPRDRSVTMPELFRGGLWPEVDQALGVGSGEAPIIKGSGRTLYAVADTTQIGKYVADVADLTDKPPVNARLAFTNNQLTVQGQPQDGQVVDRQQSVQTLAASLKNPDRVARLPIRSKPADIRPETLPTLGIKTQIASATTQFLGSPVNRTFNIGVGAAKFDGVLIKPGQTFSFDDTLGDVGPETGYRQELVILEKKTVPQYGGGLCQVSTTMFRAALGGGLPIVERTNHSYAVQYYAPLGMDATIYPPSPDLKFKNNTPGYILVQTHQEGTSLTFDFYGTNDGRQASTQILSQNATTEAGGTASFRYTVAGGPEPIDKVFFSSYLPHRDFPVSNSFN